MNWEDTDEHTVMHMLGYGENIWKQPIFRDAVVEHGLCIDTLLCLTNNYIRIWGLNPDVEMIREYLQFVNTEMAKGRSYHD
tara:strand:- start:624 stop:866 length:243 start_codon:yes stop_codon:yes gene_type:complete